MSKLSDINRWYVDYSTDVEPKRLNGRFPLVILDPGCETSVATAREKGVKILGYTSWAEIADDSRWRDKFDDLGIKTLGRTKWRGDFVDMRDEKWRDFFVEEMAREIIEQCKWDGFMVDTFDGAVDAANEFGIDMDKAVQAGADMVVMLRKVYPDSIIVTNRGFEQWKADGEFQEAIDGMLIERVQTGEDLDWLLEEVNLVKDAKKTLLSLDYCKDENKAKDIVKKNKKLGFIPLVTQTSSLSPPRLMGFPGKWA